MKVLILGDIHGEFKLANQLIKMCIKEVPDLAGVFQVGDYGYRFPGVEGWRTDFKVPVYWIEGNHDNHEALKNADEVFKICKRCDGDGLNPNPYSSDMYCPNCEGTGEIQNFKVRDSHNLHFMKRGSVLTFAGKNVMFFGGATSIDKNLRVEGRDWWPGENISYGEIKETISRDVRVDVMITHDFPSVSKVLKMSQDPNRDLLSELFTRFKPRLWFFGHHHTIKITNYEGCTFICCPDVRMEEAFVLDLSNNEIKLFEVENKTGVLSLVKGGR